MDSDGVSEIMTAQYTYLWGRADSLGAAYTILKWDSDEMSVVKAGFLPCFVARRQTGHTEKLIIKPLPTRCLCCADNSDP